MTNKQMYDAYRLSRNPAMREWYAKTMNDRADTGNKEAKDYATRMHTPTKKAGK